MLSSEYNLVNSTKIACVANVSVKFRSKERPRNGIFGFDRARNKTKALLLAPFVARSLTPVPRSLLLNRTETIATQATDKTASQAGVQKNIPSMYSNRYDSTLNPVYRLKQDWSAQFTYAVDELHKRLKNVWIFTQI